MCDLQDNDKPMWEEKASSIFNLSWQKQHQRVKHAACQAQKIGKVIGYVFGGPGRVLGPWTQKQQEICASDSEYKRKQEIIEQTDRELRFAGEKKRKGLGYY